MTLYITTIGYNGTLKIINLCKKENMKFFFNCNLRSYYFHMQCLIRQLAIQVHSNYHQRLELMTYRFRWRKGFFNIFFFLASKLLPTLCQLFLSGLAQPTNGLSMTQLGLLLLQYNGQNARISLSGQVRGISSFSKINTVLLSEIRWDKPYS